MLIKLTKMGAGKIFLNTDHIIEVSEGVWQSTQATCVWVTVARGMMNTRSIALDMTMDEVEAALKGGKWSIDEEEEKPRRKRRSA